MIKNAFILNFLRLYNLLWMLGLPFLRKNRRLAHGFKKRMAANHLSKADIWIQAASAGEAYLAASLIKKFRFKSPVRILVTTITTQGMEILQDSLKKKDLDPNTCLTIEWFPFDIPKLMEKAVKKINPRIMVLLETELWPALLFYLKKNHTDIFIVNARLSEKSFKAYLKTKFLWTQLAPDHILATSDQDAQRYARLFDTARVKTMPNIKFETMGNDDRNTALIQNIEKILPKNLPLSVLASVRTQEEPDMLLLVEKLFAGFPNQVIAIFPRHMHRIEAWKKKLASKGVKFKLRSDLEKTPDQPGIILWDQFGELKTVYGFARVVFVGASLKPLGGQNFIEPAVMGAVTITGPFYDDFAWATQQIFTQQIVIKKNSLDQVCQSMLSALKTPFFRARRMEQCRAYIRSNQGGTRQACKEIMHCLCQKTI